MRLKFPSILYQEYLVSPRAPEIGESTFLTWSLGTAQVHPAYFFPCWSEVPSLERESLDSFAGQTDKRQEIKIWK